MHVPFVALFFFAILTLWIPGYWPVTVFQVGIFVLAAVAIWRFRQSPPPFEWPLVPLASAVFVGLLQWLTSCTGYPFDTRLAILRWATFLSVFLIGISIFRDGGARRWFRVAILWFAFLLSILATIQTFTAHGKVYWLFDAPAVTDYVMGPILYRNHYAAFIEAVLPIALYLALRRERDSLLYSGMAAIMYASVIACSSRAGAVLTTCEVILVPVLLWAQRRATGRGVAVTLLRMGALLAVFTMVVGWDSVWIRLWMPDPMAVRRELASSTLQMIASDPWLGTGLGTWATVYPRFALFDTGSFANQAHNDWLQWTAEGGIPLGIMLATLFPWALRRAFGSVWGLGVIAVFLHAIVDYPFSRPALGSWTIVLLSMLAFTNAAPPDSEPLRIPKNLGAPAPQQI